MTLIIPNYTIPIFKIGNLIVFLGGQIYVSSLPREKCYASVHALLLCAIYFKMREGGTVWAGSCASVLEA